MSTSRPHLCTYPCHTLHDYPYAQRQQPRTPPPPPPPIATLYLPTSPATHPTLYPSATRCDMFSHDRLSVMYVPVPFYALPLPLHAPSLCGYLVLFFFPPSCATIPHGTRAPKATLYIFQRRCIYVVFCLLLITACFVCVVSYTYCILLYTLDSASML